MRHILFDPLWITQDISLEKMTSSSLKKKQTILLSFFFRTFFQLPELYKSFRCSYTTDSCTSPHLVRDKVVSFILSLFCACKRKCGDTAWCRSSSLLLFTVTIRPVFHKPGHDLLMYVFKKVHELRGARTKMEPFQPQLASSFFWAHREKTAAFVQVREQGLFQPHTVYTM